MSYLDYWQNGNETIGVPFHIELHVIHNEVEKSSIFAFYQQSPFVYALLRCIKA